MRGQIAALGLLILLLAAAPQVRAEAAVLLGEPYGGLGKFSPTGHVAVYLSRVCADSPIELRRCRPGELGVVISRYNNINGYDWLAIPVMPYLYAVERAEQVPLLPDAQAVAALRDNYRRRHLLELFPDGPDGQPPTGPWVQLVGAAYDRRLFAFQIETAEARDDALIIAFNSRPNQNRFNGLFRNCADFAKDLINFYYPKAVRRNVIADVGLTTPKQVAKSLVRYSQKHPELASSAYIIEQVPGSLPRSKRVRGVLEALVTSKKYAIPMVAVHFLLTPALAAGYFTTGRFRPARHTSAAYEAAELESFLNESAGLLAASPDDAPFGDGLPLHARGWPLTARGLCLSSAVGANSAPSCLCLR